MSLRRFFVIPCLLGLAMAAWLFLAAPALAQGPVVNTAADDESEGCAVGACTLREAIAAANGDTITFAGSYTIYLNSTLFIGAKTVTIDGGGRAVTVSGDSGGDGTRNVQVFRIGSGGVVTLIHLSIVSGTAAAGGGIENYGALVVQASTLAGNSAADGGGIYTYGTLTVQASTLAGNSAALGGGIDNVGTLNLIDTLIAGSPSGGDCLNQDTLAANDHNLVGDGSCSPALSGDPRLGPLADNGGPTLTFALLPGSPAIDAGANCLAFDQRGVARPQGAACDVGAFELVQPVMAVLGQGQVIAPGDATPSTADGTDFGGLALGQALTRTFTISNSGAGALNLTGTPAVALSGPAASDFSLAAAPSTPVAPGATTPFQVRFAPSAVGTRAATITIASDDPAHNPYAFAVQGTACADAIAVQSAADGGAGSLRQAIADVCDGGRITFADSYTIYLDSTLGIDAKTVTVDGGGHAVAVSGDSGGDGTGDVQVFHIGSGGVVTLTYLSIVSGTASSGGGIENEGTLTVQASTLAGNSAGVYGGGIYNNGTLTVQASTLAGNSAGSFGGGIRNWATLRLIDTLIAGSSGGDCANGATLAANDHNLVGDGSCSPALSGDPRLGPLADNGGPTLTFALLPGSPAIDAGASCLAFDQRGIARPQGGACDVGAFESRGFSLVISGGDHQSTLVNTAFTQPLSVTASSAYGEPVGPGGVIGYTAPGAGASLAPAVLTATTRAGGAADVTATANGLAGSYTVTATAAGALTPATFSLTNALPPAPVMAVLGNGAIIAAGDAVPSPADGTDFGGLALGQALARTFTISNCIVRLLRHPLLFDNIVSRT